MPTDKLQEERMTHKEVLEKAIQKAIKRKWSTAEKFEVREGGALVTLYVPVDGVLRPMVFDPKAIIFDQAFAKALWGRGKHVFGDLVNDGILRQRLWSADDGLYFRGALWQFHLQMMVISEDPVKYLGNNI